MLLPQLILSESTLLSDSLLGGRGVPMAFFPKGSLEGKVNLLDLLICTIVFYIAVCGDSEIFLCTAQFALSFLSLPFEGLVIYFTRGRGHILWVSMGPISSKTSSSSRFSSSASTVSTSWTYFFLNNQETHYHPRLQ